MKLTFYGAAKEVTGSCFMLEACGKRLLIDCGMQQGGEEKENDRMPFSAADVDYVLVTHAHIDHSGRLPLLTKEGFQGRIFATGATCELLKIMLMDSAHIQESDAKWRERKGKRAGEEPKGPLYVAEDARKTLEHLVPCSYQQDVRVEDGITARFIDAGHLLGSAYIKFTITENNVTKSIVFSGDIGNVNRPIIKDPQEMNDADYAVMESTYGNRFHEQSDDKIEKLAGIFDSTFRRGGNVVIPSFAVGRTQELLYLIREIKEKMLVKSNPDFPVFVDSPLALEATRIYSGDLREYADEETAALIKKGIDPISFTNLNLSRTSDESIKLNSNPIPKVIISSSGMCEAGRIRHHLKHNLWRPECSIVFSGYQARGTLGRLLLDGADQVKLFGERVSVKAQIHNFVFMSAHADKNGLTNWIRNFRVKPQKVFVVHGEEEANLAFTESLRLLGFDAMSPDFETVYDLAANVLISAGIPAAELREKKDSVRRISPAFLKLKLLGEKLVEVIGRNEGGANKDLYRFADQIKALVDYWDK